MDCATFQVLKERHVAQWTDAEVIALRRHYRECATCRARHAASLADLRAGPHRVPADVIELFNEAARRRLRSIAERADPEAMEQRNMSDGKLPTVAGEWAGFERAIFTEPDGRPIPIADVQRIQMRRAFYAGALCMLSLVMNVSDDGVSEEQGGIYLDALHKELAAFNEQVKAGKA